MARKVITLDRDTVLWEAGDAARTIAIVESGKLLARTADGPVGVTWPRMVLGESALFSGPGGDERRTATVVAIDDETVVAEYPPEVVRTELENGAPELARQILLTLIGQACRNFLMVIAEKRGYDFIERPLMALVRGIADDVRAGFDFRTWDTFSLTARTLYDIRDLSDRTLQQLGPDVSLRGDLLESASATLRELFEEGGDLLAQLEAFLRAEKERSDWWAQG